MNNCNFKESFMNKKYFLLILLIFAFAVSVSAQDVIVLTGYIF
jgi:hypothetical protein